MSEFYFDTYAIIELIKGNLEYEFAKESTIITSVMNLAELNYAILLEKGENSADEVLGKLNFEFLEITPEIAINASLYRYKNKRAKLSYVDCVGYILAKENNLTFLTGDKEFENVDNVNFVK